MAWLSTGTPARPKSSCSGLANAEPANASAMSRECRGVFAGERTCVKARAAMQTSGWKSRERIKKATRAFHALAKKVFLQHEIDIQQRTRLFNALVVSILLYNSEIWVPTRAQVRWIHIFYLRCLRRMGGFPRAQGTSLRCTSVEKDADAECLLSHRVTTCWIRNLSVPLSAGPFARPPVCP